MSEFINLITPVAVEESRDAELLDFRATPFRPSRLSLVM